jgi:leucyl/phenylalanyl-tRNA---protein transferase
MERLPGANENFPRWRYNPLESVAAMPVYLLGKELAFPPPSHADPSGLLAVGGDLRPRRLLLAYSLGIFPWYEEGQPILWWSPDPRLILRPDELHIARRLRRTIKQGVYRVTFDQAFASVIEACAETPRRGQRGTWITPEMKEAYIRLYQLGYAHSAESWLDGELAGGIYGVSLGRCFFGESMFFRRRDASKVAFAALVDRLKSWEFHLIDAQVTTLHLMSLGGKEIPRAIFLNRLEKALLYATVRGKWER